MKQVHAIVTKCPCPYMPLNVPVNLIINHSGYIIQAHRLDNCGGTFLATWQAKRTEYYLINY